MTFTLTFLSSLGKSPLCILLSTCAHALHTFAHLYGPAPGLSPVHRLLLPSTLSHSIADVNCMFFCGADVVCTFFQGASLLNALCLVQDVMCACLLCFFSGSCFLVVSLLFYQLLNVFCQCHPYCLVDQFSTFYFNSVKGYNIWLYIDTLASTNFKGHHHIVLYASAVFVLPQRLLLPEKEYTHVLWRLGSLLNGQLFFIGYFCSMVCQFLSLVASCRIFAVRPAEVPPSDAYQDVVPLALVSCPWDFKARWAMRFPGSPTHRL